MFVALTAALWALIFFATFACLKPAAAERLVGSENWRQLLALVARVDAYIKSHSKYTPRLEFDKNTPRAVQDIVRKAEADRLQRAARHGVEL